MSTIQIEIPSDDKRREARDEGDDAYADLQLVTPGDVITRWEEANCVPPLSSK